MSKKYADISQNAAKIPTICDWAAKWSNSQNQPISSSRRSWAERLCLRCVELVFQEDCKWFRWVSSTLQKVITKNDIFLQYIFNEPSADAVSEGSDWPKFSLLASGDKEHCLDLWVRATVGFQIILYNYDIEYIRKYFMWIYPRKIVLSQHRNSLGTTKCLTTGMPGFLFIISYHLE